MTIVTLSTDIGQQDYIVGAIKGQLLSSSANLTVVDISHYLSQANFPEAAYICSNAFEHFPAKTIHIIILNFFENKCDSFLLAEYNNQYIICADNGILTMITNGKPVNVYKVQFNLSDTFLQTTQKMATIVARLNAGETVDKVATPTLEYAKKNPLKPVVTEDSIRGQIIFIDNFENVVVNITKPVFEEYCKGRKFNIIFKKDEVIDRFSSNYLDVADGEKIAWFNSAGYLELAVNKGNMAGLFGLQGFNELNYKEGKSMQNKLYYTNAIIVFKD